MGRQRIQLTDEQTREAIRLYTEERMGLRPIGKLLGVSDTVVLRAIKDAGVPKLTSIPWRAIPFEEEHIQEIVRLYVEEQWGTAKIGDLFGVSHQPIFTILADRGITKRRGGPKPKYPIIDGKKKCSICGDSKPVAPCFSRNHYSYRSECNECRSDLFSAKNREKTFGISTEEYQQKLVDQNNVCAICGRQDHYRNRSGHGIRNLAVDHNHETGQIRGLLCGWCNRAVGFLREDPDLARQLADYLVYWKAKAECSKDDDLTGSQ